MNDPQFKIIYESEKNSSMEWRKRLEIEEQEFERLISEGIMFQNEKGQYRNTFVGTLKLKQNVFYSIPKCFKPTSQTDNKSLKIIVSIIEKCLLKYQQRIKENNSIKEQNNYFLFYRHLQSHTEFDLYITLKANYLRNGLYRKKYTTNRKQLNFSRVQWSSTINKTQPVFSNESPIYVDPIVKNVSIVDNRVTIIHLSILSYLAKKYQQFDYENNIAPLLKAEGNETLGELDLISNTESSILVLKNELNITYKDEMKSLIQLLIEFFEVISNRNKKAWSFFGTCYFHKVWEDALKLTLNDEKSMFIDRFAQPVYNLDDGNYYDAYQEPDILKEVEDVFYVIDAKYYVLEYTKPGWKDIVKQFFYKRSFLPSKTYKAIENMFLIPLLIPIEVQNFTSNNKYVGKVIMEINGNAFDDFDPINIIKMNPITVLNNYSNNQKMDLSFLNLVPKSL